MVGKTIAIDLAKKHAVTSTDIDPQSLAYLKRTHPIQTKVLNVKDHEALSEAIQNFDLVISAVPGFLGLQTMEAVIRNKKNLVDISFMPEDVLGLDALAKQHGVTVVMDCGVAPGMPNYIVGYHNETMKIDQMEYMVGGLPRARIFPFEYKAPFSPCDVIEEYTRPARYIENGHVVVKPAMSDLELLNFESVGTLEAFNSDGLRSLIFTMKHIPDMKEKTLRYPGHIRMIEALIAAGFLSKEPVMVNGTSVVPFDLTTQVLFKAWHLEDQEPEFTIMRVALRGTEKGIRKKIIYDLLDAFDPVEKLSSMSRTTGFTATATAEMILSNLFNEKGVFPPELVGKNPTCFHFIYNYLKERKVHYKITEQVL